jgi:xylan 1,4-beta-xylosidase
MVLAMTLLPTGFAQAQSQAPQYTTTGSIAGSNAYATGPDADVSNSKNGLRTVTVDAATAIGSIRPLTGVDGSPFPLFPGFPNLIGQWREAGVSFTRMHDLFGVGDYDLHLAPANAGGDQDLATILFGGDQNGTGPLAAQTASDFVNPKVIFPDPSADPEDPRSYNFPPTDINIAAMRAAGTKVMFRVGRSYGLNGLDHPPPAPDFDRWSDKWAEITRHVALHYVKGWDRGMINAIDAWEIWNEPDLGLTLWPGTIDQYYLFYRKIALAIKSVDQNQQVGGPGMAFNSNYFYGSGDAQTNAAGYEEGFLRYLRDNNVPLDFYSWHFYAYLNDTYQYYLLASQQRKLLDSYGFSNTKSFISEWNGSSAWYDIAKTQTIYKAVFVSSAMSYMQDGDVDAAFYYRGDALYDGMFENNQPSPVVATFRAHSILSATPIRLSASGGNSQGYTVLAGKNARATEVTVLITNFVRDPDYESKSITNPPPEAHLITSLPYDSLLARPFFGFENPDRIHNLNTGTLSGAFPSFYYPPYQLISTSTRNGYDLTIRNLPWGYRAYDVSRYRIDATHTLTLVDTMAGTPGALHLQGQAPAPSVDLIVLRVQGR